MHISLSIIMLLVAVFFSLPSPTSAQNLQSQVEQLRRVILQQEKQLQDFQEEVRHLRSEIETLNHYQSQLANQQQGRFLQIDEQFTKIEETMEACNCLAAEAGIPFPPAEGEKITYQHAIDALHAGRYQKAIQSFQHLLQSKHDSKITANMQYWLSESYYGMRDFQKALQNYQKLLDDFPNNAKVSHALLKIGYIHDELKNKPAARQVLESVVKQYPNTAVSRLAEERLRRLKLDGF